MVGEHGLGADDLRITQVRPEWCAVETGGVLLLLFLTSVASEWLPDITAVIRAAGDRREDGRMPTLSVFRLDKRYPLDVGFDQNIGALRDGWRQMAPSLGANAVVLQFDGFLAFTMRATLATLGMFSRPAYPTSVHPTVVSAASWLAPYVSPGQGRSVRHYVNTMNRMQVVLGCET